VETLLRTKFPLFRFSGIQVNVHILFFIFAGSYLYQLWDLGPGFALLIVGTLWVSILLHEFGHCYGARYQGGDAHEILIWPLGGLALCEAPQTPWAQGFVAAAGPAVNLVLAGIGLLIRVAFPPLSSGMDHAVGFHPADVANVLIGTNMGLFLFNMLIPAFPMDMGRIYQAVLWVWLGFKRSYRIAIYTSFICAAGMIIWAVLDKVLPNSTSMFVGFSTLLLIGIWIGQTAWNELQALEGGAYDDHDEPWRATFRYHPQHEDPDADEPGVLRRWLERREQIKAQRDADVAAARSARLDEILRRVNQVGTEGLTAEEKAFLDQESARLREKK